MSKPKKVTVASIKTVLGDGTPRTAKDIALALGYGGKTGKVSNQTLDKVIAGLNLLTETPVTEELPQEPQPPVAKSKATKVKTTSANPFAFGLKKQIFDIVSKGGGKTLEEHAEYAARLTGRPVDTARAFIRSMSNPKDNFNRGRTTNIGRGKLVKLASIA